MLQPLLLVDRRLLANDNANLICEIHFEKLLAGADDWDAFVHLILADQVHRKDHFIGRFVEIDLDDLLQIFLCPLLLNFAHRLCVTSSHLHVNLNSFDLHVVAFQLFFEPL